MSRNTEITGSDSQCISRRRALRVTGVGGAALLAGCGGVLGNDSNAVRDDQSEPPEADFRWVQSTGYAATGNIVVEIHHEGGDPIDVTTLSITIEDGEKFDRVPHTETELWAWDDILDNKRNFESLGTVMEEEDVVAITSNPLQADLPTAEDVTGTIRLVWTSPENGDTHVLTSYELKECVGNESDDVQRCS